MKAFLLAGGLGERLRPLTLEIPKCLVPVRGVPLLEYWLRLCERHGIDEVLVNVSQHPERLEAFLAGRPSDRVRVRLVREDTPRGTAGTVRDHREFVTGEESFWVVYTDNLTALDLGRMQAAHQAHDGAMTIGVFRTATPTMAGIVELGPADRVVSFTEKPARPASDLANAGLYLARQPVVDLIPADEPLADFGYHVLPRLVGRMYGYRIREYFVDVGTPAALARAEAEWVDPEARPASGPGLGAQGGAPA